MRDLSETLATEPGAEAVEVSKTAVLAVAEAASATITLALRMVESEYSVCASLWNLRDSRCNFRRF